MDPDVSLTGVFYAKVLNNVDPLGVQRLFVRVLGVHDVIDNFTDTSYGIWINHKCATRYRTGDIPKIGDLVYMEFMNINGKLNPNIGVWSGVVLQ